MCLIQYNNGFPFTISVPLPLPFPLPHLPISRPILCSFPVPGPFLTALRVLLTLALVIVIVIASTALFTARPCGIRPFLILIIIVGYLIPFQWSNGLEVAWIVLPAASRLDLGPEIIATVPRETLTGAFNLSQGSCMQSGAIDLISEGTWVVPPQIVHSVTGCVKHLPHI